MKIKNLLNILTWNPFPRENRKVVEQETDICSWKVSNGFYYDIEWALKYNKSHVLIASNDADSVCACCGTEGSTHAHHILPKALGGDDRPTNLVNVCPDCHWKIHGRKTSGTHWKNLVMAGIARAKAEGKFTGRKATARAKTDQIQELLSYGMKPQEVADQLGIGIASVYRYRKKGA